MKKKDINPYDLGSVAKNFKKVAELSISSLRSLDIYSAGGPNSGSSEALSTIKNERRRRKS